MRHLRARDAHTDAANAFGRDRRLLVEVKKPVAPIRLLKTERFFQREARGVDSVLRKRRARNRQCHFLFESRSLRALRLVLVVADRARRSWVDFDEHFFFLRWCEEAHRPCCRFDARAKNVDQSFHRQTVSEKIRRRDRVEAARRAAVFARRTNVP